SISRLYRSTHSCASSCVPLVRRVSFLFVAIFTCARAYLYVCATSSFAAVFVHSHQLTPIHTFAPRPYVLQ
ncbi:hypothetical protein B0H14DRAFT_2800308, partial [Mycena olivaceomarginata]